MAASQNGWVANLRTRVSSQLVPGTQVKLTVRTDAPGLLLLEVASAFDRLVEDIDNGMGTLDDWGYAEREIRGGTETSNHASGTAIDLNATKHPLGKTGTFTADQTAMIRRIVDVTGGVVRWGGDYGVPARGGVKNGRPDEMHFEINDGMSLADCERALVATRMFNTPKEVNTMDFNTLWVDFYGGAPKKLGDLISWAATHAARANENAAAAREELQTLNDRLSTQPTQVMSGMIDYRKLAVEMLDEMARRAGNGDGR